MTTVTPAGARLAATVDGKAEVGSALEFADLPATVVLQPTPLCNLRCRYCYLPNLANRGRMDPGLARRLAEEIAGWPSGQRIEVLWHGGEPLTTGQRHLGELIEPFDELRRAGRVRHGIQTNATLLSESWCDFLAGHEVAVEVSINGPRWANDARRSLSGAESFDRSTRGISLLRAHGISFSAIAVVRPERIPVIVERADEYLGFFAAIGAREVGFNIEEQEGHNIVAAADRELVDRFWQALIAAWMTAGGQPRIRDFDRVLGYVQATLTDAWQEPLVDLLPTISYLGDVVLLSPELAGYPSERHGDFVVGNIADEPLRAILERGREASYVAEFQQGSQRCRDHCGYFEFCHAGQAANRWFEHGDFLTNETTFCRHSRQAPFDAVPRGAGARTRAADRAQREEVNHDHTRTRRIAARAGEQRPQRRRRTRSGCDQRRPGIQVGRQADLGQLAQPPMTAIHARQE